MPSRYSLNKTKYLLPPELGLLRKIFIEFGETDLRNCLIMELALRTGGRAQEILNIEKGDLNPHDKTVFIRGMKGSNDREIPLHAQFYSRVSRFSEQVPHSKLFNISYDRLFQIWHYYRPAPKTFHSLRHTFAIELYQRTRDVRLVQVALGHRSITNTMIYADYVYSQQELRRLIL